MSEPALIRAIRARRGAVKPYPKGTRVRALIGDTGRCGTVVRDWWPYRQYRVLWDRGQYSNIDHDALERVRSAPPPPRSPTMPDHPTITESIPGRRWDVRLPDGASFSTSTASHAKRIATAWRQGYGDQIAGHPPRHFNNFRRPERSAYRSGREFAAAAQPSERPNP